MHELRSGLLRRAIVTGQQHRELAGVPDEPWHREILDPSRNTNYYEMGLLHPKIGSTALHLYTNGYRDGIDAIDAHGCVDVPEGPGLGVEYDWDFMLAHRTDGAVYK